MRGLLAVAIVSAAKAAGVLVVLGAVWWLITWPGSRRRPAVIDDVLRP